MGAALVHRYLRMMRYTHLTLASLSAASALFLAACDSSSSSSSSTAPALNAQAVDGYLVGASVYCDDAPSGGTGARGALSCPAGTELARVRGGSDVGFDADASSGGTPFAGELIAPADLGWVTPMTTLAIAMASGDGGYDARRLATATATLAAALNLDSLDLAAPADSDVETIRRNAQVHQLISAFAADADAYGTSARALAGVLQQRGQNGMAGNLSDDADALMRAVNAALGQDHAPLVLDADVLEQRILSVMDVNRAIDSSQAPADIDEVAKDAAVVGAELTFNHDRASVRIESEGPCLTPNRDPSRPCNPFDRDYFANTATIDDFLDDELIAGYHRVKLGGSLNEIDIDRRVLSVNRTMRNAAVTLGVEIVSTDAGDRRSLAFVTDEARLSGLQNDAASLTLVVPDNASYHARSVTTTGVETELTLTLANGGNFDGVGGDDFELDIASIREGLVDRGLDDVLRGEGNYRVTVVIGGVRINERDDNRVQAAQVYRVDAGSMGVAGAGLQGYVSVTDYLL